MKGRASVKILHGLILLFVLFSIIACASTRKYEWGRYDSDLYKYYARSITQEDLARNLQVSIQQCEVSGKLVPPGLYGEYGYMLYETGHYGEAIQFFQKEHDKWPESRFLMTTMIRNCKTKINPEQESKDKEPPKDDKTN